ncbi:Rx, N-terminal [Dillenia turbinata]|uniref:Rx, N-terminal n=1 Tax=Dillenia turbinata TaxID=194707 RepID=A0AAN8ZGT7_9MAGN
MAAEEQSLLASSLRDLKVRLASRELRGFARQQGFGEDVRKWRATLSEVMDLLVDAEEKQNIKGKDDVKIWLSELTHLAYDLDDVLDDLEYELLRRKKSQEGVQERSTSWSEQIQSLRSRIEEITGRFEEIEDDGKYVLKLQANPSMRCTTTSVRPPTTSSVVKSDVVGRDKDVEAILKLLPKTAEKELEECKERIMRETVGSSSLTTLTLSEISSLTCLPEEFFKYLVALEELTIYSCNELTHLWNNDATLKDLGRLRSLKIYGCGKFRSFFPTGEAELSCGSLHLLTSSQDSAVNGCEILECFPATGLPSSLKKLVIFDCESLWCLPDGVMQRNNKSMETEADGECCLEGLIISGCPSLESFPTGVLPATLRTLWISNCPELESISGRESISGYNFPRNAASSLESIYFNKYPSLKSLPKCLGSSTQLTNLADLTIWNCEGIEWFPEEGLSSLNLRRLGIDGCKNLKSLPNNIQNLTSLEYLVIHCCPSLEWIPPQKGGLPHNLRVLEIYHCERLEESLDWSHHLHTHSALTSLFIEGEFREVVSVLDDDSRLLPLPPPSLNLLRIAGLRNLERISSSRGLNSLRHLKIGDCPMLQNLPNQGILPSLLELYIWGCPLLKPKCLEEEGGEYSSHLSLIPRVSILDSW